MAPVAHPDQRLRAIAYRPAAPPRRGPLDGAWIRARGSMRRASIRPARLMARAAEIAERSERLTGRTDDELGAEAERLRPTFRAGRETRDDVDAAAALVREAAARTVGQRPFEVQIAAGLAMLEGAVAEMATGEGKTLAAALPAALRAWRGRGVHVVTVNDYLASRDADALAPLHAFLGLRVGVVTGESDGPARRDAYDADITYSTSKELAADWLRDRLRLGADRRPAGVLVERLRAGDDRGGDGGAPGDAVMRGLEHAIVDEADSVLIDEAVTPLILSGGTVNEDLKEASDRALEIAGALRAGRDYRVDRRFGDVRLTDAGRRRVGEASADDGGVWRGARRAEELVTHAVAARELYTRDEEYVLRDGAVVIVDPHTGRLLPDRTWRGGIQQAVEAKEGVDGAGMRETLARVSFQRFFGAYASLCGMTGTAREVRHELWDTYRLPVARIPTRRPVLRKAERPVVLRTREAQWARVVEEIRGTLDAGRPVLVGTRSVGDSESLASMLDGAGVDRRVLNAVRHAEESTVVAEAGRPGRVTIATNMAGRGTDIVLGPGIAERGGLRVIATARHESGRVDRQLAGRAGRQGDPGSARAVLSLEDPLIERHAALLGRLARALPLPPTLSGRALLALAQALAGRAARRRRRAVAEGDRRLGESLGFAGREH